MKKSHTSFNCWVYRTNTILPLLQTMWPILAILLCWCASLGARGQSNYDKQANSIEYQPGLPPSTILDGKVAKLDEINSTIALNRTRAYLNCGQGIMHVDLNFDEPFYGVAYADFDRNSACMVKGRGVNNATLELPLKGSFIYTHTTTNLLYLYNI